METGAYGAAKAGGSFSCESFLQRPETVLRLCCAVFALIVFACILGDGYMSDSKSGETWCIFNRNSDACHYGVGIGVIAFLAALLFLGLDVYFPTLSNATYRKYLVLADLGFSALWSFLWFVGFCFLANQWASTTGNIDIGASNARAAIAFTFFSILSWVPLACLAYKRYRIGVDDFKPNYVDPTQDNIPPYSSYPNSVSESYQHPPFTNNPDMGDGYEPPVY
ncbi:synaptogyrin-2 [Ascaphus truei]|uniref:synaptogyrin-2 n=1 Tax=Ascaphus truei TaxID=8439 RepID=UPI003F5A7EDE